MACRHSRLQRTHKDKGSKSVLDIPDIEFANAKLLNLPDGYYLAITTYQNKGGEKKYKPEVGIDMGIKTTITTSEGKKYKVLIEESERIKKCQQLIACASAPVPVSVQNEKVIAESISKINEP